MRSGGTDRHPTLVERFILTFHIHDLSVSVGKHSCKPHSVAVIAADAKPIGGKFTAFIVPHLLVGAFFIIGRDKSVHHGKEWRCPFNIFEENQLSKEEERLVSIFRSLSDEEKIILYGKALDLKRTSVADDERYLDNEGKSWPSSGTEGGAKVV